MLGENYIKRGQLRGYIFEVVIRQLLKKNGWSLLNREEIDRVRIHNNYQIEIKGRGTWHQIDTPCVFSRRIPFTFPLRLLVEAKYYSKELQKDKIRSYIGVVKDISENYFIDDTHTTASQLRYNDIAVFFSATGFQEEAVNLAFAHGIKTISYRTNPQMAAIKNDIADLETRGHYCSQTLGRGRQIAFMKDLEDVLEATNDQEMAPFLGTYGGNDVTKEILLQLREDLNGLTTNFMGISASGELLHFIGRAPFPEELFEETDEQHCRVYYEDVNHRGIPMWLQFSEDRQNRKFFFDVPAGLEEIILRGGDVLNAKGHFFETISVSFIIGNMLRSLALKIDKEWLARLKGRKVG